MHEQNTKMSFDMCVWIKTYLHFYS